MFDKFQERCTRFGWKGQYARLDYQRQRTWERWKKRVEERQPRLVCQECGGEGGEEDGSGPFEECGYCRGTGLVDAWTRGYWLRGQKYA